MTSDEVAARTRTWLGDVVVGLDLCPFARGPLEGGRVRIVVSEATDLEAALTDLWMELDRLTGTPVKALETTLLVVPGCLGDFEDYLDALHVAEGILAQRGFEGIVQIASFHPDYCFADAAPGDPANHTNRSPFPMFHLLREDSVTRAVDGHPDIAAIPERNAALLRTLDPRRLEAWRRGERPEE